jgi:hypothetical protein
MVVQMMSITVEIVLLVPKLRVHVHPSVNLQVHMCSYGISDLYMHVLCMYIQAQYRHICICTEMHILFICLYVYVWFIYVCIHPGLYMSVCAYVIPICIYVYICTYVYGHTCIVCICMSPHNVCADML